MPTFPTLDLRPGFSPGISLRGRCPKPSLTHGGSVPRPEPSRRCHTDKGQNRLGEHRDRAQGERERAQSACGGEQLQKSLRCVCRLWPGARFEGKLHCHSSCQLGGGNYSCVPPSLFISPPIILHFSPRRWPGKLQPPARPRPRAHNLPACRWGRDPGGGGGSLCLPGRALPGVSELGPAPPDPSPPHPALTAPGPAPNPPTHTGGSLPGTSEAVGPGTGLTWLQSPPPRGGPGPAGRARARPPPPRGPPVPPPAAAAAAASAVNKPRRHFRQPGAAAPEEEPPPPLPPGKQRPGPERSGLAPSGPFRPHSPPPPRAPFSLRGGAFSGVGGA